MYQTGGHQECQHRGARHLNVLRCQQHLAPLDSVGHHSADQGEEKNRNAAEKLIECQQECGVAKAIDQPALCDDLHPRADAGRTGSDPHQPEIAILKCFEDATKR